MGQKQRIIRRVERRILDISTGRVRLGMTPEETDRYIQSEYRKLRQLKGDEACLPAASLND